jgi:hypothetical protein
MQNLSSEDWERIVFSDECKFEGCVSTMHARGLTESELNGKFAIQTSRWGPSVHVWGAITADGYFALKFLSGNINAQSCLEVLKDKLAPLTPKFNAGELYFQQDGAPAHRAHSVTEYLNTEGIQTLAWPPPKAQTYRLSKMFG